LNYKKTLLIFLSVIIFSQIADRLLFVILPMWLLERSFSATQIGGIFSLAAIVMMLARFMISKLSDKWGRKKILVMGGFLSSISSALYPAASRFYDYAVINSAQDFGRKAMASVWNSMIGDKFKGKQRTSAIAVMGTFLPASRAVAAVFGIVITTFLSVVYGFYIAAASLFIVTVIILLFYKEDGFVKSEKKAISFSGITAPILLISLVGFANAVNFTMAYTPAFFVLSRSLGLTENNLFFYYLLAYIISIFFAYKTGSWIEKHGKERMIALSIGLTGVFVLLYSMVNSISLLLLPMIGIAVSFYVYSIAFRNVLIDLTDDDKRGEQTGFSGLLSDIGAIIGPILGGLMIDLVSLQSAFIVSGLFAIGGGFVALYLRRYSQV